jgi:tungstate transport system permease protein
VFEEFWEALVLIFSGDPEIWSILGFSYLVSGAATAIAAIIGIPLGIFMGMRKFRGKTIFVNLTNSFMGFPPVVMGVIVYLLLSSVGPLGSLRLLYTPPAIIIAQALLCLPIITGITIASVSNQYKPIVEATMALGGSRADIYENVLSECAIPILSGVMVGFGQSISEVGAAMIVGGNIRYSTRTITTSIVWYTSMGENEMAIALGTILLATTFLVMLFLTIIQMRSRKT